MRRLAFGMISSAHAKDMYSLMSRSSEALADAKRALRTHDCQKAMVYFMRAQQAAGGDWEHMRSTSEGPLPGLGKKMGNLQRASRIIARDLLFCGRR